jgi:DNA-binding CsgD family transcriptional regulator
MAELPPHAPMVTPVYRRARVLDLPSVLTHLSASKYAFGPAIAQSIERLLTQLLREEAIEVLILARDRRDRVCEAREPIAAAITGFLRPDVADEWGQAPPNFLADAIFELETSGHHVLLRRDQVALRNASGDGLDLVFLAYASPLGDSADPIFSKHVALTHDMFRVFHAGYHCRRAFHPAVKVPGAGASLEALGFRSLRAGSDVLVNELSALDRAPFHPFIVLRRTRAPILRLSPAEQNLLLHALIGFSDAEMAHELGLSEETIRKRWRRVFERVVDCSAATGLFPKPPYREAGAETSRGPEKRKQLLSFIAAHLEELRPFRVSRT